jgi:hypothetical protein
LKRLIIFQVSALILTVFLLGGLAATAQPVITSGIASNWAGYELTPTPMVNGTVTAVSGAFTVPSFSPGSTGILNYWVGIDNAVDHLDQTSKGLKVKVGQLTLA